MYDGVVPKTSGDAPQARISLYLDEGLRDRLRDHALANRRSLNAEAAVCIEAELDRRDAQGAAPPSYGSHPQGAEGAPGDARELAAMEAKMTVSAVLAMAGPATGCGSCGWEFGPVQDRVLVKDCEHGSVFCTDCPYHYECISCYGRTIRFNMEMLDGSDALWEFRGPHGALIAAPYLTDEDGQIIAQATAAGWEVTRRYIARSRAVTTFPAVAA